MSSGWNGSMGANAPKKVEPKAPSKMRGLVALAAVVVIGGVAAWWFLRPEEKPVTKTRERAPEKKIVEVTPVEAPVAKELPAQKKPVDRAKEELRAKLKKMSHEERQEWALEQMKNKELDLNPTTNRPFRTATELQLARIFMTEVGEAPPPRIPGIPTQELVKFTEIMIADNPKLETDSEEWKNAKDVVKLAKQEMQKFIKEGGTPDEFIDYYQGVLENAFEKRRLYMREFVKTAMAEPDIANELYHSYNEKLEKEGIKKMVYPQKFKDKVGIQD